MRTIVVTVSVLMTATVAFADDAACSKFKWSVAREQTAFAAPGLPAIASGQVLPAAGANIALEPQEKVAFVKPPARKPKVDPAFAAVVSVPAIAAAGTYEVTLSDEAWIDVLQNGSDIRSSGFSGQPGCAGVRKSVKFALQPGPATIQISGATAQSIKAQMLAAE